MSVKKKNICSTEGVEVIASPRFSEEYSNSSLNKFIFEYDIHITNNSAFSLKLISRKWEIIDSFGSKRSVSGEGVVGQQPEFGNGDTFSYSSWCPLSTPIGLMRGSFLMQREIDGSIIEVLVPDMLLAANFIHN